MSQKHENIAGGMSYRTLAGINSPKILSYLNGMNSKSLKDVLEKNKDYYAASADKTKARLLLAKKRVEVGYLESDERVLIDKKIEDSVKWLENLKTDIQGAKDYNEFNAMQRYKEWHAIKMVPSAVEGILLTALIDINVDKFKGKNRETVAEDIENLNSDAKKIFDYLLNLTEKSDFDNAEILRIQGYEYATNAIETLLKYTKIL
jgi:hypothetical protein